MLGSCDSISSAILAGLLDRGHCLVHPLLERLAILKGLRDAGRELRLLLRELGNFGDPPLVGHLMRHFGLSQLRFESAALGHRLCECCLQFGLAPGEVLQRSLLLNRRALLDVSERRLSVGKPLLELLPGRGGLCEPCGEDGFALCMMLGSCGSISSASLARLLNGGRRVLQPLRDGSERRLGFRQSSFELLAFAALLIDGGCVRITELGLFVEKRRVRHQAIESEKDRSKRRLGLDEVIKSTQLEREHRELFVPLGHDHDRNLELSGCYVFQDLEGLHTRMAMLDQQDLERKRRPWAKVWWKGIELPAQSGNGLDDVDRPSRPSEALPRECGIADIEKPQAPPPGARCGECA